MHDRKTHITAAPRFVSGLAELSSAYDVLLCDVWGVVHDGLKPHLAAVDALLRFRSQGGKVILISNAPVPAGAVRFRLDRMHLPRQAYDAIVTSGDMIASFIAGRGNAPLFNIGPSFDRSLYREVRKLTGELPRRAKLEDAAYAVCTGLFDPDTETPADYDGMLAIMLERQLDLLCANPDIVVHVGSQLIYCAGAIAERYETLGGKVVQGGKPFPPIYDRALAKAGVLLAEPLCRDRVLVIGDSMQTDIKGAIGQSLDSLFIAGGIHRSEIAPDRADTLNVGTLNRFLRAAGFAPTAAMLQLKW